MEICGGQTHTIVKYGIDELLPKKSPGARSGMPGVRHATGDDRQGAADRGAAEVIFCSFGDMLRVPGSAGDLSA